MPVTSGTYANNETLVFAYLVGTMGLNVAAACGVLANIEHESGFDNDAKGDWVGNNYTSYGLCQWHDPPRFTNLKNYAGSSYTTVQGQMSYLAYELQQSDYSGVWSTLTSVPNSAQGAYTAAAKWCTDFEKPANKTIRAIERGNSARNRYWVYYSDPTNTANIDMTAVGTYISEGYAAIDPESYTSLTSTDPNSDTIAKNLSKVEEEGYDCGYLIDVTHKEGEFRFYIPEFSEQAGAKWNDIDIRGRSVSVKSYESTSSRAITISLDLYAGVGFYAPTSGESGEDTVSRLHKDAYFLKSLEYPDYSSVITRPPPIVHLILGAAINLTGVVSSVVVEHMKPRDSRNRSMYLKISFTVVQTAVNPMDYKDIREGKYSIASTADIDSVLTGDNDTNAPQYAGEE